MKTIRKTISVPLCRTILLLLAFCLPLTVRYVCEAKETTYTVRIFAGTQGTIDGENVKIYKNCSYGDTITFNQNTVKLNDNSRYYIRGIRESGRDNNTVEPLPVIPVTGDIDYVVAYGILGSYTQYTINYVDEAGSTIAQSETYYGNIGDKPVVACLYIDGYIPQTGTLSGTLKEDSSQNTFTFVYKKVK